MRITAKLAGLMRVGLMTATWVASLAHAEAAHQKQHRACSQPRCLLHDLWPRFTCAPGASPKRCRMEQGAFTRSAGTGMSAGPVLIAARTDRAGALQTH